MDESKMNARMKAKRPTERKKSKHIVGGILVISWLVLILSGCDRIKKSKEQALRVDLRTMRDAIDQYTLDRRKAPQTLDDLVKAGYLKRIPEDPMTGRTDWSEVAEDISLAADKIRPGIADVHSVSNQIGRDGTAYYTW